MSETSIEWTEFSINPIRARLPGRGTKGGFNLGNAIKYIWRADEKGTPVEDLKKAAWYVAREIERRERNNKAPSDCGCEIPFCDCPPHLQATGDGA